MAETRSGKYSDRIDVVKADIVQMDVDVIVNAANSGLREGSGVCGAVFKAAGPAEMRKACEAIGHCSTGDAVITPGFALKARFVVHAVGPKWHGGGEGEAELLASCYARSLDLAAANGCRSIAFPLISSGIYGYPKREAWEVALSSCTDWLRGHPDADLRVTFCVLSDGSLRLAKEMLG